MKYKVILFLILSYPLTVNSTNMGFMGYPEHTCFKPQPPLKPFPGADEFQFQLYERELQDYQYRLNDFIDCINDYIRSAERDINEIKRKARSALSDAEDI